MREIGPTYRCQSFSNFLENKRRLDPRTMGMVQMAMSTGPSLAMRSLVIRSETAEQQPAAPRHHMRARAVYPEIRNDGPSKRTRDEMESSSDSAEHLCVFEKPDYCVCGGAPWAEHLRKCLKQPRMEDVMKHGFALQLEPEDFSMPGQLDQKNFAAVAKVIEQLATVQSEKLWTELVPEKELGLNDPLRFIFSVMRFLPLEMAPMAPHAMPPLVSQTADAFSISCEHYGIGAEISLDSLTYDTGLEIFAQKIVQMSAGVATTSQHNRALALKHVADYYIGKLGNISREKKLLTIDQLSNILHRTFAMLQVPALNQLSDLWSNLGEVLDITKRVHTGREVLLVTPDIVKLITCRNADAVRWDATGPAGNEMLKQSLEHLIAGVSTMGGVPLISIPNFHSNKYVINTFREYVEIGEHATMLDRTVGDAPYDGKRCCRVLTDRGMKVLKFTDAIQNMKIWNTGVTALNGNITWRDGDHTKYTFPYPYVKVGNTFHVMRNTTFGTLYGYFSGTDGTEEPKNLEAWHGRLKVFANAAKDIVRILKERLGAGHPTAADIRTNLINWTGQEIPEATATKEAALAHMNTQFELGFDPLPEGINRDNIRHLLEHTSAAIRDVCVNLSDEEKIAAYLYAGIRFTPMALIGLHEAGVRIPLNIIADWAHKRYVGVQAQRQVVGETARAWRRPGVASVFSSQDRTIKIIAENEQTAAVIDPDNAVPAEAVTIIARYLFPGEEGNGEDLTAIDPDKYHPDQNQFGGSVMLIPVPHYWTDLPDSLNIMGHTDSIRNLVQPLASAEDDHLANGYPSSDLMCAIYHFGTVFANSGKRPLDENDRTDSLVPINFISRLMTFDICDPYGRNRERVHGSGFWPYESFYEGAEEQRMGYTFTPQHSTEQIQMATIS